MDSYIPENESNLRKRLEQIAGARIRKYLETFNMEEFMLRKIKHYSRIQIDIIDSFVLQKTINLMIFMLKYKVRNGRFCYEY